jgi:hypothetical protein
MACVGGGGNMVEVRASAHSAVAHLPLCLITIYAPMIYTASRIIFWMRAYPLRGKVGGGWALEFSNFLGPVK